MPDPVQIAAYAKLLSLTPADSWTAGSTSASVTTTSVMEEPVEAGGWWPYRRREDRVAKDMQRRRPSRGLVSLALLVFVPTIVAISYFWLLAADRYESEARFVLRAPGTRMVPGASIANLLPGAGASRANDDGYIVHEFLESRDMAQYLEKHANLREAVAAAGRDPIWRFPNLFTSKSDEGLYRHFRRMVATDFNSTTGVSLLQVQAFTPGDAQRIAAAMLDAAQGLVNRLNERSQRDAIKLAEAEADRMRQRALLAQAALTAFREREQLVDPSQATLAVLETIARLSMDSANISVQINEITASSPNAPHLANLQTKRAAYESQIAKERHRLAGDAQSIAPRIAEYERLMLEREFAERALLGAMSAVELARVEAFRQHVYLERVAAPGQPDYPSYPWKIVWSMVALVAGCMAWRTWRILIADAHRHGTT